MNNPTRWEINRLREALNALRIDNHESDKNACWCAPRNWRTVTYHTTECDRARYALWPLRNTNPELPDEAPPPDEAPGAVGRPACPDCTPAAHPHHRDCDHHPDNRRAS